MFVSVYLSRFNWRDASRTAEVTHLPCSYLKQSLWVIFLLKGPWVKGPVLDIGDVYGWIIVTELHAAHTHFSQIPEDVKYCTPLADKLTFS